MVEEQRTRVEEAMTKMVNEVDKLYLRKMQAELYKIGGGGSFKRKLDEQGERLIGQLHQNFSPVGPVCNSDGSYQVIENPANCSTAQGDMHRCAAKCCDNNDMSAERVHQCVENCSVPLNNAQKYIHGEFEHFQSRLQRCVMQCNDEIRDKMGPKPSDAEVNRYSMDFERCAVKCVDSHLALLPSIMKKMKEVLGQGKYQQETKLV